MFNFKGITAFFKSIAPVIKGAATAIGIGGAIASGISGLKSARQEAALQVEQGNIQRVEAEEDARITTRVRKAERAKVAMAFVKSGVTLQGSPLLLIDEQEEEDTKEVDSIRSRGFALQRLERKRSEITERRGREALIGGLGQAVVNAAVLI